MFPTTPFAHSLKPLAPPQRVFSLAQANASLVYVGRVAHDVVVTHCQVVSVRRQVEGARGGRLEVLENDYRRLINRLRELVRELDFAGVELRDFEKGTVEFPCVVAGKPAFFSWMPGQASVQAPLMAVNMQVVEKAGVAAR